MTRRLYNKQQEVRPPQESCSVNLAHSAVSDSFPDAVNGPDAREVPPTCHGRQDQTNTEKKKVWRGVLCRKFRL